MTLKLKKVEAIDGDAKYFAVYQTGNIEWGYFPKTFSSKGLAFHVDSFTKTDDEKVVLNYSTTVSTISDLVDEVEFSLQ